MHIDAGIQWGVGFIASGVMWLYSTNRAARAAERERVRHDAEFETETRVRLAALEQFQQHHEAVHDSMETRRDAR